MSGTQLGTRWTVYGNPVDYCLSRTKPEVCQLEFNVWIMLLVVVLGSIKMIVLVWAVLQWWLDSDSANYLRTVGDALASFLERPDPTTEGMCLITASQLRQYGWKREFEPQTYTARKLRWMNSMSPRQFWSTQALYA